MELTTEQAIQKAVEAHKAGKLQDAESLYRAVLQNQPNHPDANHNLGVLAISVNKFEAALPLFKNALKANPNQGQFWLSFIDALIKTNQLEIAKSLLEQGKKLGLMGERVDALEVQLAPTLVSEKSESILQKQASSFTQQREKVSAKKEKKKNSSSNQTNLNQSQNPPQKELNALLEHYQQGRHELAQDLATSLTEQYPSHPFGWKVLGVLFKQIGKYKDSLIINQKVVGIAPNDAEAHSNLGNIFKELGRLKDAEKSYKKAIEIKPDYAEAHSNLGNIFKELGRLKDAEKSYMKAITIKPDYAQANYNLGITLQELGKRENAEKSYKKAIEIKPDYAEAHYNLGLILHELGRFQDAETSYKHAIGIKPDYKEAHSNLGITLQELGRLEDAEVSYKIAITIKPDLAETHSNLGIILKDLGRLEEAEESYKKAIAIKPDLAEAHSNLGITLKEFGRVSEAAVSFAQAIKLKPDYIKARSEMLTCLYLLDKEALFFGELDYFIQQDKANSVIGSLICRSLLKYGKKRPNLFCNWPLKYVLLVDLKSRCSFDEIFVKNVKSILIENKRSNRTQPLLSNGIQTSGNLFDRNNNFIDEIQKAILFEIERYRINFENSDEGFIRKWPVEHSLNGWLISMKSGGELRPHIHANGWLSGSIYINVPPKTKIDSGNLVVALGKDSDTTDPSLNSKKIIDVVTGSMVLFPASLMHHTIPFESDEERIVLAFDVVPK